MSTLLLIIAVGFLAYSNGANDNFKGVASLFGSGAASYRTALSWATITTLAGSIAAVFVAEALLRTFSGKGLVPDTLITSPEYVLAVAAGAGATVILATQLGFPISTTHSLTGALVGAGVLAAGDRVDLALLGGVFVLPLLVSPMLAVASGTVVYAVAHHVRLRLCVTSETCVCAGFEPRVVSSPTPGGALSVAVLPTLTVEVEARSACAQRYLGSVLGIDVPRLLDALHFLSAGGVSFARGLNDTPKIAGLLLALKAFEPRWSLIGVAAAIAAGGVFHARKIAHTMSHRIIGMNTGQGLAANLSTAVLVTTASLHGLPVSTTHVSVGSLLGIGFATRQVKWKPVLGVLASWVVTLPCAATLAGLFYWAIM